MFSYEHYKTDEKMTYKIENNNLSIPVVFLSY